VNEMSHKKIPGRFYSNSGSVFLWLMLCGQLEKHYLPIEEQLQSGKVGAI
jgi:hypothetical protein